MKSKQESNKYAIPTTVDSDDSQNTLERVRERAYELWELGGCQDGNDDTYWTQAESEILAEDGEPEGNTP